MADPAKVLFRNASYDGQLMRTLAAVLAGSADLGEALATARRGRQAERHRMVRRLVKNGRPGATDRRRGPGLR